MFGKNSKIDAERLVHAIEENNKYAKELSEALGSRDSRENLETQVEALKREKADLLIEADRREEAWARKEREIEHKTGLHLQQVEQERKFAVEEAKLEVAKTNIDADKERDKKEMDYMKQRLEKELEGMRSMWDTVVGLVPKVNVDRKISENYGALDSGKDDEGTE